MCHPADLARREGLEFPVVFIIGLEEDCSRPALVEDKTPWMRSVDCSMSESPGRWTAFILCGPSADGSRASMIGPSRFLTDLPPTAFTAICLRPDRGSVRLSAPDT